MQRQIQRCEKTYPTNKSFLTFILYSTHLLVPLQQQMKKRV